MLDPIPKRSGYGQHAARIGPVCIYARSDFPHLIRFHSSKEGPDLTGMAWSGFGQLHLVQKQTSVQVSFSLVLIEPNGPVTSFPLSDSVASFHRQTDSLDHIAQNSLGLIWLWLTVRFGLNRSGPETSLCARIPESTCRQSF